MTITDMFRSALIQEAEKNRDRMFQYLCIPHSDHAEDILHQIGDTEVLEVFTGTSCNDLTRFEFAVRAKHKSGTEIQISIPGVLTDRWGIYLRNGCDTGFYFQMYFYHKHKSALEFAIQTVKNYLEQVA